MKPLYVSLALAFLILIVYGQVHGFELVNFDDRETVRDNPHIQNGVTLDALKWAFTSGYAANWLPVTWISHMLDFDLFGLDPGKFHLINVLIHTASTMVLLRLLLKMTGRKWESTFVSFVFALHPLHVESVAWVSERKDVLSAFFWVLTMWLYVAYVQKPKTINHLLTLASFLLGLMSKQMLVTLPLALLLIDYWPLERPKSRRLIVEKIPFFLLSAVASFIAFKVQHQAGLITPNAIPFATRVANALISYVAYLIQFVWPAGLSVFYPYPASMPVWEVLGASVLLIAISVLALRRKYLAVGWFWYLGTLVPVIGLVQVGLQARADRYTYIPMIGRASCREECATLCRSRWSPYH